MARNFEHYYTAAEVIALTGGDYNQLQAWRKNGVLERIIPPGKVRGVYTRKSVDKLVERLREFDQNVPA